jgi:hypothetical protein
MIKNLTGRSRGSLKNIDTSEYHNKTNSYSGLDIFFHHATKIKIRTRKNREGKPVKIIEIESVDENLKREFINLVVFTQ